ncbi:hypothetical protein [Rubinisphaera sp. JC750]|uniref:hypothetical protein n=1 Tax=Rubinisphaera sp. JC750 TaxID=2898658 RepID=UPI001F21EECD|nr:hypothetical protein [Rubinisphaera sp. JC750]
MRSTRFAFLSAAILLTSGCGSSGDTPDLGQVSGIIKVDGNPTPNVAVRFAPVDGGRPSTGTTDDTGRYELVYSTKLMGAKVGTHNVSIVVQSQGDEEIDPTQMGLPTEGDTGNISDIIKTAEVTSGSNTIDLEFP